MSEPESSPDDQHSQPAAAPDPEPVTVNDEDDGFVNPAEGDVQRDADGKTIPQVTQAGHLGKVKARPMAYGTVQKFFGSGTTSNLEAEDLAELFDRQIVKPDLSAHYGGKVTADDVQNMKPLTPRGYLQAIMDVSGIESETIQMYSDGSADVEVSGN